MWHCFAKGMSNSLFGGFQLQQATNYPEEPSWDLIDRGEDTTRKVAMGALLGALSIALAATASFIPRIPGWGIALFDPVSLIWIIAFLIGGIEVGMMTTIAGFFGLFLFDPTGIGPVFKLLATLPMILVPWIGIRYSKQQLDGKYLSSARIYSKYVIVAIIIRMSLMIPLNLVTVPLLYGILDINFIITYTVILNSLQSFWDALIPYLIVHKSGIFEHFRMW